ncbi:MAG: hypothetical protein ABR608_10650 [Pseudonocardiaceae bacterium]|nr:hypothetical protein [Actinomycetota bacterium]
MPTVLTEASTVKCVHQGIVVTQASRHALTVDGAAVLVQGDLLAGRILGCQLKPVPCVQITVIAAGVSATLMIGDQPVMLATAQGSTNVGQWLVVDAGQTKLEAA